MGHWAIAQRLKIGGESERKVMIEMARGLEGVISLGRGDPDMVTPRYIIEAAKRALDEGYTGYSPWIGYPDLREAIASKLKEENNLDTDPEKEIIVTVGAQEALFLTMQGILDPGDEILVPEPRYTPYDMAIALAGGRPVSVQTFEEDSFEIRSEEIEKRITPRTKALLLITPNNPTGAILSEPTLWRIAELAKKRNLMVISDELYEKLVYDGVKNISIGSFPGMKERTITINGFSKTYCMTGMRVGYLAGPAEIISTLVELKYTITINAPSVSQRAALAALRGNQDTVREMVAIYDQRRRFLMDALDELGVGYTRPKGAFYLFASIKKIGMTSFEFCKNLLRSQRVLVFPGTVFGPHGEGYIRISLLAQMARIEEATKRLKIFLTGL